MNILVIGNGFDLAHGLPTKYSDFLNWVMNEYNFFLYMKKQDADITKGVDSITLDVPKELLRKAEKMSPIQRDIQHELWSMINSNVWIEYFMNNPMHQKENWIDFESEISEVIQSLDKDMHSLSGIYSIEDELFELSNKFLKEKYSEYTYTARSISAMKDGHSQKEVTYKDIRDKLLDDLNRLIRALEIYLTEYVGNIEIQNISSDINQLEIDKVLSFNYTDTFSKLYNIERDTEENDIDSFDYIHGKADINKTVKTNNMVLGIDEYLPDDRKNKDVEFIAFKKYYERIYKQTGCKYKAWLQENQREYAVALLNKTNYMDMMKDAYSRKDREDMWNLYLATMFNNHVKDKIHNLYIFGHSKLAIWNEK